MLKKKIIFAFWMFFMTAIGSAQVSVVSIQLLPYNISPEAMLSASIMNNSAAQQVEMISKLYNFNNELLLTVRSLPFNLKSGINAPFDGNRKIALAEYSSNNQANYIKTTHGLPSGAFKICIEVIYTKNAEPADQFCDEIESDFNQYLYLVFPTDKDVIETKTPLLTWSHSEPFNILSQGEYYRMIVSDINANQSPEEAITINTPLMMRNYLTTHSLQYPYDAKELQEGKHYAWQVQKVANGVVINKTEAWEFSVITTEPLKENKYAVLKKVLDGGYYVAENNKVFFKFEEKYTSGNISCVIYNSKREAIKPKVENEGTANAALNFKQNGYNRYEINLNDLDIEEGFHTLEVRNEKREITLLKFYVQ
ncbi:MAG: hypothetical protein ACT4ON_15835 [Bacteroidota bacterium]